jgi:2-polyprenyl-3-methyl-5-hydroxy-6-metoxy-1,4-benzoquinol methylase
MLPGLPIIEPAALGLSEERYRRLRNVFDVQSYVFTCEILPAFWALYPTGQHHLTLLDVGPRTGAGTGLLQYLHHPESFSRIKLRTTAIDIDSAYKEYAAVHSPDVEYLVGDIFDPGLSRVFDVVLCSHTLEHLTDPLPFLRRLQALSRSWVIVACPFDENDCIPGHLSSIGYDFFEQAGVHALSVYRSLTWHQSMACVAVFKGQAEGG